MRAKKYVLIARTRTLIENSRALRTVTRRLKFELLNYRQRAAALGSKLCDSLKGVRKAA